MNTVQLLELTAGRLPFVFLQRVEQLSCRPSGFVPCFPSELTSSTPLPPLTQIEDAAVRYRLKRHLDSLRGVVAPPPVNLDALGEIQKLCEGINTKQLTPLKVLRAQIISSLYGAKEFLLAFRGFSVEFILPGAPSHLRMNLPELLQFWHEGVVKIFNAIDSNVVCDESHGFEESKRNLLGFCRQIEIALESAQSSHPQAQSSLDHLRKNVLEKLLFLERSLDDRGDLLLQLISPSEASESAFNCSVIETFIDSLLANIFYYNKSLCDYFISQKEPSLMRKIDQLNEALSKFERCSQTILKHYRNQIKELERILSRPKISDGIEGLEKRVFEFVQCLAEIDRLSNEFSSAYSEYFDFFRQLPQFFNQDFRAKIKQCPKFAQFDEWFLETWQKVDLTIRKASSAFTQIHHVLFEKMQRVAEDERQIFEKTKKIFTFYPTSNAEIRLFDLVILHSRKMILSFGYPSQVRVTLLDFFSRILFGIFISDSVFPGVKTEFANQWLEQVEEWKGAGLVPIEQIEIINQEMTFLFRLLFCNTLRFLEFRCGARKKLTHQDQGILSDTIRYELQDFIYDQLDPLLTKLIDLLKRFSFPAPIESTREFFIRDLAQLQLEVSKWHKERLFLLGCKDFRQLISRYVKLITAIENHFCLSEYSEYISQLLNFLSDQEWDNYEGTLDQFMRIIINDPFTMAASNRSIYVCCQSLESATVVAQEQQLIVQEADLVEEVAPPKQAVEPIEKPVVIEISLGDAFNHLKASLLSLKSKARDISDTQEALDNILEGYLPCIQEFLMRGESPIQRYGSLAAKELLTKLALCLEQAQKYALALRKVVVDLPLHNLEISQTALGIELSQEEWDLIYLLNGLTHSRRLSTTYLLSEEALALFQETRNEVFKSLTIRVLNLVNHLLNGEAPKFIEHAKEKAVSNTRKELVLREAPFLHLREIRESLSCQSRRYPQCRNPDQLFKVRKIMALSTRTIIQTTGDLEALLTPPLNLEHAFTFVDTLLLKLALLLEQTEIYLLAQFEDGLVLDQKIAERELRYCHNTELLLQKISQSYRLDFSHDEFEAAKSLHNVIGHLNRYVTHFRSDRLSRLLEELRFLSDLREHVLGDGFLTVPQHEKFARDFSSSPIAIDERIISIVNEIIPLAKNVLQLVLRLAKAFSAGFVEGK